MFCDNVRMAQAQLVGVQIVSLASAAGVDVGDMDDTDVAALFGTTKGYKASEPNIQNDAGSLKKTSDGFPIRS